MVHPAVSHRVSRWQLSLHRPITSERAMRAGPISDVPYVCNNGRAVAVDGRQPFLPVGVPAVNSGSVVGATPCLALWRPPAAGGPAALCGSWYGKGQGSPEPLPHALACANNSAPVESPSHWDAVVTGRSGRQPLRIRGLTAVRGFRAWVARESLRWGGSRLDCLVLPPWD